MVNSFNTWHGLVSICFQYDTGTKNVAKELRKICAGLVRARDWTWFTELSDKDMFFLEIFNISLFSKNHQSALVLVQEEMLW